MLQRSYPSPFPPVFVAAGYLRMMMVIALTAASLLLMPPLLDMTGRHNAVVHAFNARLSPRNDPFHKNGGDGCVLRFQKSKGRRHRQQQQQRGGDREEKEDVVHVRKDGRFLIPRMASASAAATGPLFSSPGSSDSDNRIPSEEGDNTQKNEDSRTSSQSPETRFQKAPWDTVYDLNGNNNNNNEWDTKVNGAPRQVSPNVLNSLGTLIPLTRPFNDVGVVVAHLLGAQLMLKQINSMASSTTMGAGGAVALGYWKLMRHPFMIATLLSLILTSSTSMVINDYYDAKLGRDEGRNRAVADEKVPHSVVKAFLNYLYAASLITLCFVPGIPTRLSVVGGLVTTYYYTKHLKPVTWFKNAVCASLIAFSPFTSALAISHIISPGVSWNWLAFQNVKLLRLVGVIFTGIMGREILMDCDDYDSDMLAGVQTVPVKCGKRFATRVVLSLWMVTAGLAMAGPLAEMSRLVRAAQPVAETTANMVFPLATGAKRRYILATAGSVLLLRRGWQTAVSEGEEKDVLKLAVQEFILPMFLCFASLL